MYDDSVAEIFYIFATSRLCGNIHCSYQHYQPGKITLQVSVLMIEYLFARHMNYGLCNTCHIFAASVTVAVEIFFEKSGICLW